MWWNVLSFKPYVNKMALDIKLLQEKCVQKSFFENIKDSFVHLYSFFVEKKDQVELMSQMTTLQTNTSLLSSPLS